MKIWLSLLALALAGSSLAAAPQSPALRTVQLNPITLTLADGRAVAAEEGLVFVPENRSKPDSRTIAVHFFRLPGAPGLGKGKPVFQLPGGPGDFVNGELFAHDRLTRLAELVYPIGDLVVVNQRGNANVPFQPPLWLKTGAKPLDRTGSPQINREVRRAAVEQANRDYAALGVDLSGYNIIDIADDINDLRAALGYPKIILRGQSFGSQWSLAFLKRWQQYVDRALLSGIEPLDYGWDSPLRKWEAVQRLEALAQADPAIASQLPPEGLLKALREVMVRLDKNPVTVEIADPRTGKPIKVTVGGDDVRFVVTSSGAPGRASASRRNTLEYFPHFVVELSKGDYRYLAALAWQHRKPGTDPYIGQLIDQSLGITKAREELIRGAEACAELGEVNAEYIDTRDLMATKDVGDEFRADPVITVPTLLVHGDIDYNTPRENAVHLAELLKTGHLMWVTGGGTHAAFEEMSQHNPDGWAAVKKFMTADFARTPAAEVLASLPKETRLPALRFDPPASTPALYERWLKTKGDK